MHIPDGFLDPKMSTGLMGGAAFVLSFCLSKVREAITAPAPQAALATAGRLAGNFTLGRRRLLTKLGEQQLYQMGMVAALIFAAQMFNFPIGQGTSGHLIGGVLAAVILGPFAGTTVISVVLAVQMIFFADGGLLALGANIINLAVLASLVAYYMYYWLKEYWPEWLAIASAAWISVPLAAVACAFEMALSGTVPLSLILPAMLKIHIVIGLAEALVTLAFVYLLRNLSPNLEKD